MIDMITLCVACTSVANPITHILEGMDKELLNGLYHYSFGEGLLLPLFLRFGSVNMPHIPLGPCLFLILGEPGVVYQRDDQSITLASLSSVV